MSILTPRPSGIADSGVSLGVIGVGAKKVTDAMMLAASKALSGCVTAEELRDESVLPRIERLR